MDKKALAQTSQKRNANGVHICGYVLTHHQISANENHTPTRMAK